MSSMMVIYAVIVGMWAVVLVPSWVKRRRTTAAAQSVERFSDAMRVLARRRPVVVAQASATRRPAEPSSADEHTVSIPAEMSASIPASIPVSIPAARRAAGASRSSRAVGEPSRRTSMAARRRRVAGVLLLLALGLGGLAGAALLPFWAPIPATALLLAYLALPAALGSSARRAGTSPVRRGSSRGSRHASGGRLGGADVAPAGVRPAVPATVQAQQSVAEDEDSALIGVWGAPIAARGQQMYEPPRAGASLPDPSRAAGLPAESAANESSSGWETAGAGAAPDETVADPDAWEPVPVPLPTYVTAPVARRPIRVIDLTTPGAWTESMLLDERPRPAADRAQENAESSPSDAAARRAVND